MSKLHVAQTGANAGKLVPCPAKIKCRTASKHIEASAAYDSRRYHAYSTGESPKDLTADEIIQGAEKFSELPQEEKDRFYDYEYFEMLEKHKKKPGSISYPKSPAFRQKYSRARSIQELTDYLQNVSEGKDTDAESYKNAFRKIAIKGESSWTRKQAELIQELMDYERGRAQEFKTDWDSNSNPLSTLMDTSAMDKDYPQIHAKLKTLGFKPKDPINSFNLTAKTKKDDGSEFIKFLEQSASTPERKAYSAAFWQDPSEETVAVKVETSAPKKTFKDSLKQKIDSMKKTKIVED